MAYNQILSICIQDYGSSYKNDLFVYSVRTTEEYFHTVLKNIFTQYSRIFSHSTQEYTMAARIMVLGNQGGALDKDMAICSFLSDLHMYDR